MLEAINLGCVRGDRRLFKGLNFSLTPGTCLQLQGPNGTGKTSLLRIICGLLTQAEGEIRWQGANIRSLGEEYSAALTYVGHRSAVKEELTSVENLRISSGLAGIDLNLDEAHLILRWMGLGGREHLAARFLSEGQRRRLALAPLLARRASLWLLDEVLTSLDKAAQALMLAQIEEHLSKGGTAIIATHQDLKLSASSFQRIELAL